MINKLPLKDSLGWGLALWLFGYILSIILFFIVPPSLIGWVIMPIGIIVTLWVLFKKVKSKVLTHYLAIGIVWTAIAIVLDYFFIIKMLDPTDGYYKPAVYIYYFLTFALPLIAYFRKKSQKTD